MRSLLALAALCLLSGCTMAKGLVTDVRPQDDGAIKVTKCDLVSYMGWRSYAVENCTDEILRATKQTAGK